MEAVLDFCEAVAYFESVWSQYIELDGTPGIKVRFAIEKVFKPLARRWADGERSQELHDEMMAVK